MKQRTTELTTSTPEDAVFNARALDAATQFAVQSESTMDRNIAAALEQGHFGEPWPIGQTIGPVKDRGDPSGVILRHGKLVRSWGDVTRTDMTFSIAKSYLALCAGIAVDDGLIRDVHDPVRLSVNDGGFDSAQNKDITWAQLLTLTSEWEGALWDKPDWIDHNREVMGKGTGGVKGEPRDLRRPGTVWEYNDVRVNRLALALLWVFGRPLPEVLKERIMDPIGASETWQWHGYENSWVEIDGRKMQSVPGGSHWGGGMQISTLDHARIGQLMLQDGLWEGEQIISKAWLDACKQPCPLNKHYGYLWWLNTDADMFAGASASSFFAVGVGTNVIWIDPEADMVVVLRWIEGESISEFMRRVSSARTA